MRLILQHIQGTLYEDNGRAALLLKNMAPEAPGPDSLYLCFAVVVQGSEDYILPAIVMDDWGNERRDLNIYEWLEDEGHRFPRSEIFGYDLDGSEAQCFLRALELYAKLPTYVYRTEKAPAAQGVCLDAILLPDETATDVVKVKRPSPFQPPMSKAKVSWWQAPPDLTEFDFSLLAGP